MQAYFLVCQAAHIILKDGNIVYCIHITIKWILVDTQGVALLKESTKILSIYCILTYLKDGAASDIWFRRYRGLCCYSASEDKS